MTRNSSKLFVLLFLCSIAQQSSGQIHSLIKKQISKDRLDIDQQKSRISLKYTKGSYLMYDCYDKHWVCTDEVEVKNCRLKREEGIMNYNVNLPCVVFENYSTNSSCIERQQWVTNQSIAVTFCKNSKMKRKVVD